MLRRNTKGYFRSERETSALSSLWKSLKPTCVVVSLHNSAAIKLSIERRSSQTFVPVICFGLPVQNVSHSEACACHFIELTTPFSSAMTFLNDSKLSLTSSEQGFRSCWHSLIGYSTKYLLKSRHWRSLSKNIDSRLKQALDFSACLRS